MLSRFSNFSKFFFKNYKRFFNFCPNKQFRHSIQNIKRYRVPKKLLKNDILEASSSIAQHAIYAADNT